MLKQKSPLFSVYTFLALLALVVLAGIFFLRNMGRTSSSSSSSSSVDNSMQPTRLITASFYPQAFVLTELVGTHFQIFNLTPSGVEPHDYEPTAQDSVMLQQSELLVVNGQLEPWLDSFAASSTNPLKILELVPSAVEATDTRLLDPHVWLDPKKMMEMSDVILARLLILDPSNAADFQKNHAVLNQKLVILEKEYRDGLENCEVRTFITSHAAFGYLAQEYNLKQLAIAGLSPDEEPSLQHIRKLADAARQQNIRTVFFEEQVSPKLAETLAREVGATTEVLSPIESLTVEQVQSGQDYLSLMQQNLRHLRTALQCN